MSPAYVDVQNYYFFSQRRDRRFQRRVRKVLDDASVYSYGGERRDHFRADGESVVSAGGLGTPARCNSAIGRRADKAVVFPPLDSKGPKLVSRDPQHLEAVEIKSILSEKKQKFLQSLSEEKSQPPISKDLYRFNELKFASTSILSNLAKLFRSVEIAVFTEDLPTELIDIFLLDYESLTTDVVVEKREWQTDCYLDLSFSTKNKHPYLTEAPATEEQKLKSDEVVSAIVNRKGKEKFITDKPVEKKRTKKHVTMDQEGLPKWKSMERPQTAKSILSSLSFHSDFSQPSSTDDHESRMIYSHHHDVLPAELRPNILHYKRESLAPKVKSKAPKTRLEKYKAQIHPPPTLKHPSKSELLSMCHHV